MVVSTVDVPPAIRLVPPRESDPTSVARYLLGFEWADQNREVHEMLIRNGLPLWLEILRTVPQPRQRGKLLELGSPPFHITLLLQKFRDYELTLSAAVTDKRPRFQHSVTNPTYGEEYHFDCACFDIEHDRFPFADNQFDVVTWCEVIEHLTENPVLTLSEIHRVLKPGGALVVSTPNVTRTENVLRILMGGNIYDPYHLGSPFRGSRHSREYTLLDLRELIGGCGFQLAVAEARDLKSPGDPRLRRVAEKFLTLTAYVTGAVFADHLFVRAIKEGPFRWNFPPGVYDGGHVLWYKAARDSEVIMGQNEIPHTSLGWGPLEVGLEGKSQRRAGPVADVFLVAPAPVKRVVLEVTGGDSPAPVQVQVWHGEGDSAAWLETGETTAPPGHWARLDIAVRSETRPRGEIHLRILSDHGVYIHRVALET